MIQRGYSYSTSFAIEELPGNTPMSLAGCTATFCVRIGPEGSKIFEFPATISTPATNGEATVDLTPAQTATIKKGSGKAWLKVVSGSSSKPYGEHDITVSD